jgi:hypothetical protein
MPALSILERAGQLPAVVSAISFSAICPIPRSPAPCAGHGALADSATASPDFLALLLAAVASREPTDSAQLTSFPTQDSADETQRVSSIIIPAPQDAPVTLFRILAAPGMALFVSRGRRQVLAVGISSTGLALAALMEVHVPRAAGGLLRRSSSASFSAGPPSSHTQIGTFWAQFGHLLLS